MATRGPWRFGANLVGRDHEPARRGRGLRPADAVRPASKPSRPRGGSTARSPRSARRAGVQYQMTPEILLGAVVRSPGVTLFRSGDYSFDGQVSAGRRERDHHVLRSGRSIRLQAPVPGRRGRRDGAQPLRARARRHVLDGPLELRLPADRADRPTFIVDDGLGGPPVVTRLPVTPVQAESDAIVNVAFGGFYALTENKVWKLHFGFNTDFSPVGDDDEFFTNVDLYGADPRHQRRDAALRRLDRRELQLRERQQRAPGEPARLRHHRQTRSPSSIRWPIGSERERACAR